MQHTEGFPAGIALLEISFSPTQRAVPSAENRWAGNRWAENHRAENHRAAAFLLGDLPGVNFRQAMGLPRDGGAPLPPSSTPESPEELLWLIMKRSSGRQLFAVQDKL